MKIDNRSHLPALLCALALAAVGCQKGAMQSAETPAPEATAPRIAQSTPSPAPAAAPSAERPTATESYVVEEQKTSPPAAEVPHDVEQPSRAVAPPLPPASPPPPAPREDAQAARERRLAERERRLARRQAELNAREKRLQREATPQPDTRVEVPVPDQQESQPEPAPAPEPAPVPERPRPAPVTLPTGTRVGIEFPLALSSATSKAGETFRARVADDVYAGDRLAIPAGSEVMGEVSQATPGRKIGGQAILGLRFTDLVLPNGETIPLKASLEQPGEHRGKRDAATIGGGAAGGAILGRILSGGGGKGTLLGALIGAAAGTAIAAHRSGAEVVIPAGSVLNITLDGEIEVNRRR